MEGLLSRYRNLTVLLVVVVAQLLYLAYQVKTNRDERLIRVWAVSAVTPMAGIVEAVRHDTIGFLQDYFILLDVREQNRKLKADNDRLRMENVYFRNQLATAEHARALILFQQQTPSKTVAARVIGNSTVATAKAVFIDRGSTSGIEREMAVVTPEGIVGKVVAVYPLVSQVLLVTDPTFKVGVESQKGHIHGVLDCGSGKCVVEQIQNEDKVDVGEWFFTSGEDRIFPKGFPVGRVVAAEPGQGTKNVALNLSGAPGGAEEVLVVLKGIHQPIPAAAVPDDTPVTTLMPPTPELETGGAEAPKGQTQADKIVQKYAEIGKQENHVFGGVGSAIPNFNAKPASAPKPTAAPVAAAPASRQAPTTAPTTPSRPGILGARPNAPAVGPNTKPEPVLPLGAPRRKPPAGQPPQQQ
ncbi:MAG TPA: rod shape-determining protein MreC [Bryobacteraceae bacterium]|jgi:rod shape-determining protein MreC|nr:rod shape-determining protein MreC [Bryobacteraceae bacterium]